MAKEGVSVVFETSSINCGDGGRREKMKGKEEEEEEEDGCVVAVQVEGSVGSLADLYPGGFGGRRKLIRK